MEESYREALVILINSLAPAAGPLLGSLIGFLSGWGLSFCNRKQRKAAESTRQLLTAELKWLESFLSITTLKCAVQSGMIERGVKEYRWLMKHAERITLQEISPEILDGRDKLLALTTKNLESGWLILSRRTEPMNCLSYHQFSFSSANVSQIILRSAKRINRCEMAVYHAQL